jgi:putative tryptophan/tyrosine transport system substrate-binding protein
MSKKVFCLALGTLLLALCVPAQAQRPKKVWRIGFLSPSFSSDPSLNNEVFRQGLRDLGYIEGQNIVIEYRFAEEKIDRLPQLAAELIRLNPDVIVTSTTPGVLAAKKATTTVPIVIAAAGDLVQRGVVASLAQPGGNLTGLIFISRELDGKRLELLKEVAPKLTRVAYLVNPANPAWDDIPKNLEDVARALRIRIYRVESRGVDEYEAAFSVMTKSGANALHLANDLIFTNHRKRIAELAVKHRLPSIAERKEFSEAGGLITYGTSVRDMFRRAATYVDKILKGTKPGDIPVERPTKFELVINLKAAKQIGLTIPPNVLARADRVIR